MPPDAPRGLKFSFNPSLEHPGNLRYTPLSEQGLGKGSRYLFAFLETARQILMKVSSPHSLSPILTARSTTRTLSSA